MKNLIAGVLLGAVIGGVIGTVASDDIYDMTNQMMTKGKPFAKKCTWI